jgi:glycosyltransferase involved in cell wall biosynthesis
MARMHIVYVGDCGPKPSGAPISSDQLIRRLAARGCRVHAITPDLYGGDPDMPAFDAARPEIDAIHYPVPAYFTDPFDPPPAEWEAMTRRGIASAIGRLTIHSRPDVLLVRELWWPYVVDLCTEHGIPGVVLVRGNPTSAILAGVFRADLEDRFLRALRKAEWIVTVAAHFLPGLSRLGFDRVSCIENGVDIRAFSPGPRNPALARRLAIADSDFVLLHAGQIKPIKRPLDIVHAAVRALRRNANLLYIFIGEGILRDEIEDLTHRYGIANRFRFVPFVDHAAMPDYMNLADAVVMPSEREGCSRVYLEAQACGKALIASDIAGAREVVVHGETGLLARKGDVEDLAEKMLMAADDAALRSHIGACARQSIERRHDINVAVEKYRQLLKSIVMCQPIALPEESGPA